MQSAPKPRLIVGLGNRGLRYQATRHNVGFVVLDALLAASTSSDKQNWQEARQFRSLLAHVELTTGTQGKAELEQKSARDAANKEEHHASLSAQLVLQKPLTMMNLSGKATAPLLRELALEPQSMLVVHDELDLPFGTVKLKLGGGMGGHNGLKSIGASVQSTDFARLRVGIGRPEPNSSLSVRDYVLEDFSSDQREELEKVLAKACNAIHCAALHGYEFAMNRVNKKEDTHGS